MSERVVFVVMVALTFAGLAAAEEPAVCATTIVATGCDRSPIEGAAVKLVTTKGWALKGATDAEGRAEFELCPEDIAKLKVAGVSGDRMSRSTVVEEDGSRRLATITVSLCES
jgi:hypothetical protein